MASFGIAVIISLILGAKTEKFVTVACSKSDIVAQYGTSTLLECIIRSQVPDTTVEYIAWNFNKENLLLYNDEKLSTKPGYQFAEQGWNHSNMNVSLLITNTTLSNSGEYRCVVMTDSGVSDSKVHVSVKANYSKPKIANQSEKRNHDFALVCEAHGGYPKGDIRWVVNGERWKRNPVVVAEKNDKGLFNLTSELTLGPNTEFTEFVCEVYNAKGVKESEVAFDEPITSKNKDDEKKGQPLTQIVAPVVVIGSLIVGLLLLLLLRRRRQRKARRLSSAPLMNYPPEIPLDDPEECSGMVKRKINI